jgi:hypothetical protein
LRRGDDRMMANSGWGGGGGVGIPPFVAAEPAGWAEGTVRPYDKGVSAPCDMLFLIVGWL